MIRWMLDLLFPPRCVLCHRFLPSSREPVCDPCGKYLLRQQIQIRRGRYYSYCVSPLTYEEPVRGSVHRFKFAGRRFYAKAYGLWLAAAIRQEDLEYDMVTWVPVSRKRLRKRGYDQSELLCKETAEHLGAEPVRCLRKVRHNPPQSSLTQAEKRKSNVAGAYMPACSCDLSGKRVLLIDDVITSGATLEECSRVLQLSGVKEVVCATLAQAK